MFPISRLLYLTRSLPLILLVAMPAFSGSKHHWVQLGPGTDLIVRLLTSAADCPKIRIDGQVVRTNERAMPTADYAKRLCERTTDRSVREISVEDQPLPTLNPDVRRIAVIGDTGCSIKKFRSQACNDPDAWPLFNVLAAVKKEQPDLVIHVGDYHYRERPCPPGIDCTGSPYGQNEESWIADWFDPAQQLMSQVPFLFVRGNHEQCGRAEKGWFRYFSVGPLPDKCIDVSEPWSTTVAGVTMAVFDSSSGKASRSAPENLAIFRRYANELLSEAPAETWLLTHRPLWAYLHAFDDLITGDATQRAAFALNKPNAIALILSGHIHAFQLLAIENGPVQLISGNAGAILDPMPTKRMQDIEIGGYLARQIEGKGEFGFTVLSRQQDASWHLEARGIDGDTFSRCHLSERALSCSQAQ